MNPNKVVDIDKLIEEMGVLIGEIAKCDNCGKTFTPEDALELCFTCDKCREGLVIYFQDAAEKFVALKALVKKHSVTVETPKPEPAKERLMICEHWKECDGVSCGKRHIVPHVEVGVCRSYGCDAKPGAKCIPYVKESAKPDCICGETGARNCPEHNEPPTLEARIAALEAKEAKLVEVLDEMVTHLERLHLTCYTLPLSEALAKYKEVTK